MNRYLLITFLLLAISLLAACKKKPESINPGPKYVFRYDGNLDVLGTDSKVKASFRIEIVEREDEMMRGMKYRDQLDPDQGMFFIFQATDYFDFWMQDTYLPLDMLFISADGTINQIHENAQPFSDELITPDQPHLYVLEVIGGLSAKLNIKAGDKVSWKRLTDQ